jgi:hypothetical protein
MPRKVDPSELSAVSRQILSRMSDPPVDLNDLWEVPASECEDLLQEAYENTVSKPFQCLKWQAHLQRVINGDNR